MLSLLLAAYDGIGFATHSVVSFTTIVGVTAVGAIASARSRN